MKRAVLIVIVLLLIALAGYLLLSNNAGAPVRITLPNNEKNNKVIQDIKPGKPLDNGVLATNGFTVSLFAENIPGARDLEFTPGGTLLVSAPGKGNVYVLADHNNDGVADEAKAIITNANIPHGLAFFDNKLYVVEIDRVVEYGWDESSLTVTSQKEILKIPSGGNHIYRTITFDKNSRMFVSIGSTCNVCIENNPWFNSIITADKNGKDARIFATGQRNAPFLAINPGNGQLWATGMGRDHLGDNLPPDEINIIEDGKDYGWPYCYGDRVYDRNFGKETQSFCQSTVPPIFEIPAHSAPLGLAFIDSSQFPSDWQGDLFVAYHGSWNRSVPDGYKVVRMNVEGNKITSAQDFITGFLQGRNVVGRPVDVIFDKNGTLYVSDDKIGAVYKVTK